MGVLYVYAVVLWLPYFAQCRHLYVYDSRHTFTCGNDDIVIYQVIYDIAFIIEVESILFTGDIYSNGTLVNPKELTGIK